MTLAGDDMTFAITQTGNLNVIDAVTPKVQTTQVHGHLQVTPNTVDPKCPNRWRW